MKQVIRLNERELNNFISESVNRILNEGHWNNDVYNEFEQIRETIGDDALISELYNWMSGDEIEEFIQNIKRNYDMDCDEEW